MEKQNDKKSLLNSLKKGDLIKVLWLDTFSRGGWWSEKEIKEIINYDLKNIETVGHFVMRYRGLLVIAQTKDLSGKSDDPWGLWKAIPLKTIVKIVRLEEKTNEQ